jgi:hypothetical protein
MAGLDSLSQWIIAHQWTEEKERLMLKCVGVNKEKESKQNMLQICKEKAKTEKL